jgi:hypothetical protein
MRLLILSAMFFFGTLMAAGLLALGEPQAIGEPQARSVQREASHAGTKTVLLGPSLRDGGAAGPGR